MEPRRIGYIQDKIAPPRFLAFLGICIGLTVVLDDYFGFARAFLAAFDAGAVFYVLSSLPLLKPRKPEEMRDDARENDVNRLLLLLVTLIVIGAIFITLNIELSGKKPNGYLVLGTLTVSWFFANTIFAQYYAFAFWIQDGTGGFDFPHSEEPDYADFTYFAFTLGMTFSASDVAITARAIRLVVLLHSMGAFAFNIGALAFSVGVLSGSA